MDLGGNAYGKNLQKALEEGAITMDDLNRAVANVLHLKFRMGLFENPYVSPEQAKQVYVQKLTRNWLAKLPVKGLFY